MTYWARGVSLAVLLGIAAPAGAVVLCAKTRKDGTFNSTVRIREACRKKETQLDPAALGLQGPPGQEGPQGPAGPAGQDARQDAVGLLRITGNAAQTLMTTSAIYQDIPDTAVAFATPTAGCVIAQFTALTRGDLGNAWIRVMLDGQQMDPNEVRFAADPPGPGAFSLFKCGVAAGAHNIIVQFRSANEGTTAVISERSLIVTHATILLDD